MAGPEALRNYPKADVNKLDRLVRKLDLGNSSARQQALDQTLSYVFSRPSITVNAVEILTQRSDRNSAQVLEWIREPEKTIKFISTKGKLAKKSDYLELFDHFDSSASDIARAMLLGHLSQPIQELKRAKKNPEQQQKAARKANQVGLNFAEALLENQNEEIKNTVVSIIDQDLARPDLESNTLIDFLIANSAFARPIRIAAEADEILRYLDHLVKTSIGVGIMEKYFDFINSYRERIEIAPGMKLQLFPPQKKPALEKLWDNSKPPQEHSYVKIRKSLIDQFVIQIDKIFYEPIILTADEPQATNLGVEMIRYFLQEEIADKITYMKGDFIPEMESRMIRTSQGRLIIVIGRDDEVQNIREDLWLRIREIVFQHAQAADVNGSYLPINQDELNTALEFLKPPGLDPERIAEMIPKLIDEAQGGLNAISKRGIKSKLTLKNEGYLKEMGLNEIFFQQEEQGIKVVTSWNGGKFSFLIGKDYQPRGLENISETNRDWLLLIVFSYLKAIKNRGEEKIQFIDEPLGLDQEEAEEEESSGQGDSEKQISRMPFLRVLALGDKSHEMAVERYEELTKFHFGIRLSELNGLFLQIQGNRNLLTDPNSDLNQSLDQLPHGQIIRKQLEKLFNRTMKKVSRPYWKEVEVNGETFHKLVPSKPPSGYDENSFVYMVTFVDETVFPGILPREIRCPGVAEKILQVSQPILES